ncbi:MAG: MBL fold metallo-hydrolase [Dehalococcoidia bacterium]|nr:MBL fold metallo-hydrolase [Dehalococcoidia bacterium]
MGSILDHAEQAWNGDGAGHPWRALNVLEEVAPRTWFASSFANMAAFDTDEGLVIVDPGAKNNARVKFEQLREAVDRPAHTIIYSHGHHDHVWGADLYQADAKERGGRSVQVVAHEAVPARFERYARTEGYNGVINIRQFRGGAGTPSWPTDHIYPDTTYAQELTLTVGGERFDLHHARGETDDATWVYAADRKVLATGDLFVWVVPNAGNPQKVQRFAGEWAAALRRMAATGAELLLPGHGAPIVGAERIRQALEDTARYLETIEEQTLAAMNEGLRLDEVLDRVQPPEDLAHRPYLQPVYDEPDFIVRNIWRLYGGWYDGLPSHLKPAPDQELATMVASLAGSPEALAERARALAADGNLRLACHLADWAWLAAPDHEGVRAIRGDLYQWRAATERSTMAVGIFNTVAREMGLSLGEGPTFSAQERSSRAPKESE